MSSNKELNNYEIRFVWTVEGDGSILGIYNSEHQAEARASGSESWLSVRKRMLAQIAGTIAGHLLEDHKRTLEPDNIDVELRHQAKQKLTDAERRILGLK